MRSALIIALLAFTLILVTQPINAGVIYVNADSPGPTFDGKSWNTAYRRLTDAASAANSADEVWIAKGEYSGPVILKSGVKLFGGFIGNEQSINDRNYMENVTSIMGPAYDAVINAAVDSKIDGLTISKGNIGIKCVSCSPVITNNIITGCTAALYCNNSSAIISDNVLTDNSSYGIQSLGNGSLSVERNRIINCVRGFSCSTVSLTLTDNSFIRNVEYGISASSSSYANIKLNRFVGSDVGIDCLGTSVLILGNVIAGCGKTGVNCGASQSLTFGNNTIAGCGVGLSIIGSIATIVNNIVAFNNTGISRKSGTLSLSRNDVYGNKTNYSQITAGIDDFSANPLFARGSYLYGDLHIQPNSPCCNNGTSSGLLMTDVDIDGQPRIQNGVIDIGADESNGTVWPTSPRVLRVNSIAPPGGDGSSWDKPYNSISTAVADVAANGGAEVWVAGGTYRETVKLVPFTHLYAGFTGTENSKLQRDWVSNPVKIFGISQNRCFEAASLSRIDGFSSISGDISNGYNNAIIINNTIRAGAVISYGYSTVANNFITGGLSVADFVVATSNTIVGATNGITISSGSPVIANNIVAFSSFGLRSVYSPTPVMSHNNVFGNGTNYSGITPAVTDISVDPKFISHEFGDLHISPDSKCINAGDNSAAGIFPLDADGQSRVQGSAVDIGADEYDGSTRVISPRVVYVNALAPANGDGKSWASAYRAIQSGLYDAQDGGAEVWVARGTYYENIKVASYTPLYGGFLGGELIRNQRNPIVNLTIIDGSKRQGSDGTICLYGSSLIDGLTITGGFYGVYCYDRPTLRGNRILLNSEYGIGCDGYATPVIAGNIISYNRKGLGSSDSVTFINNTVTCNGTGIDYTTYSTIANNIVAYNCQGIVYAPYATLSRNNVYANTTNYGNTASHLTDISTDPMFASLEFGNFHIQPDSPCRDNGVNSFSSLLATDIDSANRIIGDIVDIGADESDGIVWNVIPRILFVNASLPISGDGSSWSKAYRSIQSAGDDIKKNGPAEVWVARGEYNEKLNLTYNTYMYGGFAGNESDRSQRDWKKNVTIIRGGITVIGAPYSVVDGFQITGGVYGIDCTGVRIQNNTIFGNSSSGIYCRENGFMIVNNVIRDNDKKGIEIWNFAIANVIGNSISSHQTGVSNYGKGSVSNNTIIQNTVGLSGSSGMTVTNNIIALNGTGISRSSYGPDPSLVKNDVFNNTQNYSWTPVVGSDISIDPKFVDKANGDYHLLYNSPCIDTGVAVSFAPLDIDGNPRPIDGNADGITNIDIGCYEYPKNYMTPVSIKRLADGSNIAITGIISTASFADRFYVETLDRIAGIGIMGSISSIGKSVVVEGQITTVDGERVILPSAIVEGVQSTVPLPWLMNFDAIGGGQFGLQKGVQDYRWVKDEFTGQLQRKLVTYGGTSNIGMLIKIAGRVRAGDEHYFYLDGGCNFDDGNSILKGIKVDWPWNDAIPDEGSFVEMTAISSCIIKDEKTVRLLRPVSPGSIKKLD